MINKGKDATRLYTLKDNTRKPNQNMHRYTKDQLAFIQEEMKDIMYYFGYADIKEDPDNMTAFYKYPETDPELYKTYYQYRTLNKHSLEWNAYMNDEERAKIQFMLSDPDKRADVADFAETDMMAECIMHDAEMRMFGKARKNIE